MDFRKAYDSIRREKVLEVLKDMKVPVEIVDLIKKGYVGDRTRVEVGDSKVLVEMNSGIRQGCTASALIFKMVTYKIIEELSRRAEGVRLGGVKVGSLFFADDGMLLARGIEETRRTVKILREEVGKFRLEMNMEKSKCMMSNVEAGGEEVLEIEGMELVKEIKYWGIKTERRCNLYEGQIRKMLEKGKKMSNMTS